MKYMVLASALWLAGCAANPYQTFYQGEVHASTIPGYVAAEREVALYTSDTHARDQRRMAAKGYIRVGQATFAAAEHAEHRDQVIEQANAIGAHIAVYSPSSSPAVEGVPSLDTFAPPTGNPMPVIKLPAGMQEPEVFVAFYAERKTKLGIYGFFLDKETTQVTKAPQGYMVETVVEGSGAAREGIQRDDILVLWNGEPITSKEHYQSLLKALNEPTVTLTLVRDGKPLTKTVPVTKID
jgi:hypothetical protein